MRRPFAIAAVCATAALLVSPAPAAEEVDLLLVLASDVSRSVDYPKFKLQREGYANAIADPRVLKAITSGPNGKIALSFVEWAGFTQQKVIVDWATIEGSESAGVFGDKVRNEPRAFYDRTSISGAIEFSMSHLARAPYAAARKTIDISGDGTNNSGTSVIVARDRALAAGITINGLVILTQNPQTWNSDHTNPPGGLENYFRNNVIGGPGSFVVVTEDFASFGQAIIKKLIAEIAMLGPTRRR